MSEYRTTEAYIVKDKAGNRIGTEKDFTFDLIDVEHESMPERYIDAIKTSVESWEVRNILQNAAKDDDLLPLDFDAVWKASAEWLKNDDGERICIL